MCFVACGLRHADVLTVKVTTLGLIKPRRELERRVGSCRTPNKLAHFEICASYSGVDDPSDIIGYNLLSTATCYVILTNKHGVLSQKN
jgi:hypothetical protein